MLFILIISLIILQRIIELIIAKRNEKQLIKSGALEFGMNHYPWMVLMHFSFFGALILEVAVFNNGLSSLWILWLLTFAIAQIGRIWVISSLGRHWNTKIIVLPDAKVIVKGPYKYIKHPNYLIVAIEILVLPLIFQAYWTAMIFSLLNIWMMTIRIPLEEMALQENTEYVTAFRKNL